MYISNEYWPTTYISNMLCNISLFNYSLIQILKTFFSWLWSCPLQPPSHTHTLGTVKWQSSLVTISVLMDNASHLHPQLSLVGGLDLFRTYQIAPTVGGALWVAVAHCTSTATTVVECIRNTRFALEPHDIGLTDTSTISRVTLTSRSDRSIAAAGLNRKKKDCYSVL